MPLAANTKIRSLLTGLQVEAGSRPGPVRIAPESIEAICEAIEQAIEESSTEKEPGALERAIEARVEAEITAKAYERRLATLDAELAAAKAAAAEATTAAATSAATAAGLEARISDNQARDEAMQALQAKIAAIADETSGIRTAIAAVRSTPRTQPAGGPAAPAKPASGYSVTITGRDAGGAARTFKVTPT